MLMQCNKGFSVGTVVAVIIGIILLVAVAVPITNDVVESANLSGTDAIIGGVLGTLILVGAIVLVARMYSSE